MSPSNFLHGIGAPTTTLIGVWSGSRPFPRPRNRPRPYAAGMVNPNLFRKKLRPWTEVHQRSCTFSVLLQGLRAAARPR